jgi:hypothetical protein
MQPSNQSDKSARRVRANGVTGDEIRNKYLPSRIAKRSQEAFTKDKKKGYKPKHATLFIA